MSEKESGNKQIISKDQSGEENLKEERQVEILAEKVTTKIIQSEFSGPIPPPNIIKGYEDILPGAADRIITMAENQAKHRQQMEALMIHSESRDGLLGILFAFLLGLGCIIACVFIVMKVPEKAGAICGSIIGVTGIGAIIGTFINSTRINANHDDKKDSRKDDSK